MSQERNGANRSPHFVIGEDISQLDTKCFNDPIHGHIQLHPLLVKVIDTPQFQRLRNIKQLGGNYFVYPGASHNRFEHCIGTCHLAGNLARHLLSKQPHLLDEKDVLCVELAGLCHDIGHGPYSHMFDGKFLLKVNPESKWKHESGSCMMLDYLIEDNNLELEFEKYDLSLDRDVDFIKEMISGPLDPTNKTWKYKGRPQEKSFLFEIVSNERNKVDVDKWDYFARDCHHLGIKNSFDHKRFMQFLKVLTVEGENPQLCARDKEWIDLYEMFHTRNVLHRRAYQHRVSTAVETMICDAMILANDYIKFAGKDGRMLKISETVTDMCAFMKLTDHVFDQILHSMDGSDQMVEARKILLRIQKRDLYKYVGQCKLPKGYKISQTHEEIQEEMAELSDGLLHHEIVVNVKKFNYGMQNKNPCDLFHFYSKENPNTPYLIRRQEISHMLPETFEDCEIQVYCKLADKCEQAQECLVKWCKNNNLSPPVTFKLTETSLTPMKSLSKSPSDDNNMSAAKKLKY